MRTARIGDDGAMSSMFGTGSFGRRPAQTAPVPAPAVDRRPRLLGAPVGHLPELLPEAKRGRWRRITVVGEEVLANPCQEVTELGTKELRTLVDDMHATNAVADGVGLAANQIGVDLRVFVYDCPDAYGVRHVGHVINPVVVSTSGEERVEEHEGCLSVPGAAALVTRPRTAVVEGVDQRGNALRIEGVGLFARCLLHETDHLDGKLYLDHLGARDRRRAMREMEAEREETWAAWGQRAKELGK